MTSTPLPATRSIATPLIVTKYDNALQVLGDLVSNKAAHQHQQQTQRTTVIVCSTKQDFLTQLTALIKLDGKSNDQQGEDEIPASQEYLGDTINSPGSPSSPPANVGTKSSPTIHPLLQKTLHLLLVSSKINLVFCPSVSAFRAYIATYNPSPPTTTTRTSPASNENHHQTLVLDLLALHAGTSEFTLQGLSRSLSALVSATHSATSTLKLIECRDVLDGEDPARGPGLWFAQVPLLSGSVKLGGVGQSWAGRQVGVEKIVARWVEFEGVEEEVRRRCRVDL